MTFSFTAGINISLEGLKRFLNEDIAGGITADKIHHVYIENPFPVMKNRIEDRGIQKSFKALCDLLISNNIEPVWVLDYTCMGDKHLTSDFWKNLSEVLKFLTETGVKSISVSDFYLAGAFSADVPPFNNYSSFQAYISPWAKINHAVKLKYLYDIKYLLITLHPDINQNEEEISRAVKFAGGDKLELLLNSGCYTRCPLETFCRALKFHILEEEYNDEEKKRAGHYIEQCSGNTSSSLGDRFSLISPHKISSIEALGIKRFRILNSPNSIEDLWEKLIPYMEGSPHCDPNKLMYKDKPF